MNSVTPKKSLGQHWLFDETSLEAMVRAGEVSTNDTVIEIGPGLGTLTKKLCQHARYVIAIEKDRQLAKDLQSNKQLTNLEVVVGDVLQHDFSRLPSNYKVVANIPYYLTSNLLRVLLESNNPPSLITLLIQKEVAERIDAQPGNMSILSVSVQFYAQANLKEVVPAKLFTPPPKVDSQIIQIKKRHQPLFPDIDTKKFFQIVKAGFSAKRKKLRSSLSGGLHLEKNEVDEWLKRAHINPESRAQELTLDEWYHLLKTL